MPKFLLLADTGCEDACAEEIKRIIDKQPETSANVVSVEGTWEQGVALAYRSQVARRVLVEITPPFREAGDLSGRKPEHFCDGTFKVEAETLALTTENRPAQLPPTQDLVETVGDWLHASVPNSVSLSDPDIIVFAANVLGRVHVGIDLVGDALAKREWRIMVSRRSLKATVAAAAAVYAKITPGMRVLDPFGDDGTMAIEAALWLSGTSPRQHTRAFAFTRLTSAVPPTDEPIDVPKIEVFAEQLREMNAVRTNSKLAGVEKLLHSTKVDIGWVDLKLGEGSIDAIVTHPPQSGKALPEKTARRILGAFFSQAAYVLRPKGTVTCVTGKPGEVKAAAEGFAVEEERKTLMGKQPISIITFRRA